MWSSVLVTMIYSVYFSILYNNDRRLNEEIREGNLTLTQTKRSFFLWSGTSCLFTISLSRTFNWLMNGISPPEIICWSNNNLEIQYPFHFEGGDSSSRDPPCPGGSTAVGSGASSVFHVFITIAACFSLSFRSSWQRTEALITPSETGTLLFSWRRILTLLKPIVC